ncbi:hypothetical protein KTAU_30930 [Thermogemmatispora aurantia]|nr:hypothetical protein KTAU_30930 [Thermogemmatispora aurantia]
MSPAFYDAVVGEQLIQEVVNAEPQLVALQVCGATLCPGNGAVLALADATRSGNGAASAGATSRSDDRAAMRHQMSALLLRVPPAVQGPMAPMGGTGWLVSTAGQL